MKHQLAFLFLFLAGAGRGWALNLTFRVDMRQVTVAPAGVFVAGEFQSEAGFGADWNATSSPMTDANGDHIYELTVSVPTGSYQYKFINGSTWESTLQSCGVTNTYNRLAVLGTADTTLPAVLFNVCTPPTSTPYATHWWNDAVFYEVFVRSFYDNNGDGKGDLAGLIAKLDYLNDGNPATTNDLGVTALWLMPVFESPSYHGYDITDYKAVERDYGTLAQFDTLVAQAHRRGIRVILDMVLNHTSNQHPWFTASVRDTSRFRDFYVWSPTSPGYTRPSDGANLWNFRFGSYYYAWFGNTLPDLNWRTPALQDSMWSVLDYWLDRGVDGYRLDAITLLVEDSMFTSHPVLDNTPSTRTLLETYRAKMEVSKPGSFSIGEIYASPDAARAYVNENRLNAAFEFNLEGALVSSVNSASPANLRGQMNLVDQTYPKLQYGTILSNHDQERVLTTLAGDEAKMKQAAALYLTLPGIPFVYYGEEVGMISVGTADQTKRTPMQWTAGANAGFTTGTPWYAPNPNYAQYNVATEDADPASLLNHYRKLIHLRTSQGALLRGYYLPATASSGNVFSYGRIEGDSGILVASNFGTTSLTPTLTLAVSTLTPGTYFASDLYTGQDAGTVRVDSLGGFRTWTPTLPALDSKQTWILRLARTRGPVATAPKEAFFAPTLSPNPSTGLVNIALGTAAAAGSTVEVYDLQGRLQERASFRGDSYRLSTQAWPTGSYFVRIRSGAAVSTQRLVVAR